MPRMYSTLANDPYGLFWDDEFETKVHVLVRQSFLLEGELPLLMFEYVVKILKIRAANNRVIDIPFSKWWNNTTPDPKHDNSLGSQHILRLLPLAFLHPH